MFSALGPLFSLTTWTLPIGYHPTPFFIQSPLLRLMWGLYKSAHIPPKARELLTQLIESSERTGTAIDCAGEGQQQFYVIDDLPKADSEFQDAHSRDT
jgi:hypothetical protein